MDPLSAIASIIAVYSLACKIGELSIYYTQGVRNADKECDYFIDEITTFQRSLRTLKRMLMDERDDIGGIRLENLRDLIEGEKASLKQCQTDLENVNEKLEYGKTKAGLKAVFHKLSWPFKEDEVRKVIDRLKGFAASIDRALIMDNTEMARDTHSTIKRIENRQKQKDEESHKKEDLKHAEETREKIMKWLHHPDPVENHIVACHARNEKANTCRWLLDGDDFKKLRETPRSFLHLHGDSGCGKTILCSAIIEELRALSSRDTQSALAFWYYYTNDKTRTCLTNLVRALISQILSPSPPLPNALVEFWNAKKLETPKTSDLVQTLQKILIERANHETYIVIDALDESDGAERDELMEMIGSLMSLETVDVRIIVTSRTNRIQIENDLKELPGFREIAIECGNVNSDIAAHITERLQNDKILKAWPEREREKVKKGLVDKAAGMFRWVDCQLQAIRKCKTPAALERALNTLPKDLHEQYARELAGITDNSQNALKILQWLTYPQRKLQIKEITDMIAVDFDREPPVFDEQLKMWNPEGVLEICGSLVRVDVGPGRNSLGEELFEAQTLTTAHATVSEFLQTQSIRIGSEPEIRFRRSTVNLRMAETCLVYLRFFVDNNIELTKENLVQYPFARFCAEFWDDHYREVIALGQEELDMTRLNSLVMNLFQSPHAMLQWIRLCDPDYDMGPVDFKKQPSDVQSPLYYAALLGLSEIVKRFIDQGAQINRATQVGYGTPLVAASILGRKEVVFLLLERGADPKLGGWWFWGCPLAGAVERNQSEIVRMLLRCKGININCRRYSVEPKHELPVKSAEAIGEIAAAETSKGEANETEENLEVIENEDAAKQRSTEENIDRYSEGSIDYVFDPDYIESVSGQSMVYIAAAYNSPEVLKILLDEGADPNIECGFYNTALEAACALGYEEMVNDLIEKGARVNIYGGHYGSALIAACRYGSTAIVRKLIANRSDLNHAVDGDYVCALYAACVADNTDVVDLLLEHQAEVKVYGGKYGDALQAACSNGNIEIAERLLEAGSDVNHKGGANGCALYTACGQGSMDLVKLLLDKGAEPNIQKCGDHDNALQLACAKGCEEIVGLLLDKDANPNLHGGIYGNAFQAGCYSGKESIVKLLLERKADINCRGGVFWSPLQAAIRSRSEEIVKLLVELGEPVNEKGSDFSYPLLTASASRPSCDSILKILLQNGADPNLEREGDDEGKIPSTTALQLSLRASTTTVLLDYGASINKQSGYYGTALHAAIGGEENDPGLIKLLISRGADVNAPHWYHGTPLALACERGKLEDVELLLKNGAVLNQYDLVGRSPIQVAIGKSHWDIFDHFIRLGDNPTHADKRGCTGLHYAAGGENNDDAVRKILRCEVDINGVDSNGWSALHWAAASSYGTSTVLKTLLQAGINRDLEDNQGRTALDLAMAFEKVEEAAILKAGEAAYFDLPETNNGQKLVETWIICDGCSQYRGDREPNLAYHCQSCFDFDFCFRCIVDKDNIHPKDHEFTVGRILRKAQAMTD